MGGYRVHTQQIKVGVAGYIDNMATIPAVLVGNFNGTTVPPVAAGTSIGGELTAVIAAWTAILPKVGKELELLADAVSTSATMYETVEVGNGDRFGAFAR